MVKLYRADGLLGIIPDGKKNTEVKQTKIKVLTYVSPSGFCSITRMEFTNKDVYKSFMRWLDSDDCPIINRMRIELYEKNI